MPQVPIYGAPKVRAASTPVPNMQTNVPVPNIVGPVSQAVNIFDDIRKQANETAVLEAEKQAMDLEFSTFDAPETGYLNRKGKDAIDGYQSTLDAYDNGMSKIRESLKNDEQKALFDEKVAIARRQQALLKGARHINQEREQFDADNLKAYADGVVSSAAANFNDPSRVGYDIGRGLAEIDAWAKRNGKSEDVVAGMKSDLETKAHTAVIDRMLATGNAAGAKSYFDSVSSKIAGDKRDEIEKELGASVAEAKAFDVVGTVFEKFARTGDQGGAELAVTEALKNDPAAAKLARAEIKARFDAFEKQQDRQLGLAQQWAMANGNYSYAAIPKEYRAGLSPQKDVELRKFLDGQLSGGTPADPAMKARADEVAYRLGRDPEQLKETDLMVVYPLFQAAGMETQWRQLANEQDAMRKGKAGDEWAMAGPTIEARLATLGIKPKDARAKQAEDYVRRQIESERQRNGKPLTREQVDAIIDTSFMRGVIQREWASDPLVFQFEAPYQTGPFVGGVPLSDYQKIRDTLIASGEANPSPERVQSVYAQFQAQGQ